MTPAALLLALAATPVTGTSGDTAWVPEYARAVELAREEGRDLLLDFTGSDWCSWCKRLKYEVLAQEAFLEAAGRDYVLVVVDLPRSPEALSGVPDIKANRELARRYGVQSFPTVVLTTADGDEFGRTGYREGGVAPYLAHLAELRKEGRPPLVAAKALRASFDGADSDGGRAEAARRALELFPTLPEGSAAAGLLVPVLGHHRVLDPDNGRGDLARALRMILLSSRADAASIAAARRLDPENELGLLELAVYAEAYWAARPEDQKRVAAEILALHALGPVREPRAAAVIYPFGALWVASHLRDLEKAKELARLGLPHVQQKPGLARQLQGILSRR